MCLRQLSRSYVAGPKIIESLKKECTMTKLLNAEFEINRVYLPLAKNPQAAIQIPMPPEEVFEAVRLLMQGVELICANLPDEVLSDKELQQIFSVWAENTNWESTLQSAIIEYRIYADEANMKLGADVGRRNYNEMFDLKQQDLVWPHSSEQVYSLWKGGFEFNQIYKSKIIVVVLPAMQSSVGYEIGTILTMIWMPTMKKIAHGYQKK